MNASAKRIPIAIGVLVSTFLSGCAWLAAPRDLHTGTVALLLLFGFGVLAPGLFALIFAAYQSRRSLAEFWRTFYRMFFFYVMIGAPIILGLCLVYLVLSAFLAPDVLGH
ncbi:MAG: hypothetical protein ACHQZS_12005 [Candidatus Binatales bacterium]